MIENDSKIIELLDKNGLPHNEIYIKALKEAYTAGYWAAWLKG